MGELFCPLCIGFGTVPFSLGSIVAMIILFILTSNAAFLCEGLFFTSRGYISPYALQYPNNRVLCTLRNSISNLPDNIDVTQKAESVRIAAFVFLGISIVTVIFIIGAFFYIRSKGSAKKIDLRNKTDFDLNIFDKQ